jgi:fumarate hydratase subunit beta
MSEPIRIETPLSDEDVERLKVGDRVLINGVIYTGRDAAHKRLLDLIEKGEELPFDIKGQVIYYVGPTPARPGKPTGSAGPTSSWPGKPTGSAGPTSSYRMDPYSPKLMEKGLRGMIGKGMRSQEVIDAMRKSKAIYMAARRSEGWRWRIFPLSW